MFFLCSCQLSLIKDGARVPVGGALLAFRTGWRPHASFFKSEIAFRRLSQFVSSEFKSPLRAGELLGRAEISLSTSRTNDSSAARTAAIRSKNSPAVSKATPPCFSPSIAWDMGASEPHQARLSV